MFPSVTIGSHTISTYGIMAALGFLVCLFLFYKREKAFPSLKKHADLLIALAVVGTLVGAKALYLLTVLPSLISGTLSPLSVISGGFVYYGGIYGFLIAELLYCRRIRLSCSDVLSAVMPLAALFHAFGRIGCFLTGCCYGRAAGIAFLGVTFTNSPYAPNGVALYPVQLWEALFELILFFILLRMSVKGRSGVRMMSLYLLAYGIFRFLVEFLRGDDVRGFIGVLSLSQVIALISIVLAVILFRKGKSKEVP